MQKPEAAGNRALQNRITRARAEREAVIVSLVEEEQRLLESMRPLTNDHYDRVSADLDALESEVRICTRTLNARGWARAHVRAGALPDQTPAATDAAAYQPGFLTRMLLRCVLGSMTGHTA